jgi:hypothetical protein
MDATSCHFVCHDPRHRSALGDRIRRARGWSLIRGGDEPRPGVQPSRLTIPDVAVGIAEDSRALGRPRDSWRGAPEARRRGRTKAHARPLRIDTVVFRETFHNWRLRSSIK